MPDKKMPRDMMRFFKRMLLLAVILWTVFSCISLAYHIADSKKLVALIAYQDAKQSIEKDKIYRRWVAEHGGVYVKITPQTQPNPYLSNVPQQNITTTQGEKLTLVNPAYMTRQVHELMETYNGIRGHITSLNPIRQENAPDEWESRALKKIEEGAADIGEVITMKGALVYRLMMPLKTEDDCLKCHAAQGYKLGDIRGGISAAVPMERYDGIQQAHILNEVKHFGAVWIVGIAGLLIGSWFVKGRISERDRAETDLRVSEEEHRRIVDTATEGIMTIDLQQKITFANARMAEMLGYTVEEMAGRQVYDFMHPDEHEDHRRQMGLRQKGVSSRYERRFLHRNGDVIWVLISGTPLRDDNNQLIGAFGMFTNITERKHFEQKLQHSEQLYRSLVETTAAVAWEVDVASMRFTYISPQIEHMSGFPQETWVDVQTWAERIHPDDRERAIAYCKDATAQGLDHTFEYRMLTADKKIVWIRDVVSVIKSDGMPVTLRGMFFDISSGKLAEQSLKESEARLKEAEKIARIGSWEYDFTNHLLLWSDEAYAIFGIDPADGITFDAFIERIHPEDRERVRSSIQEAVRKKISPWEIEYRIIRQDGKEFYLHESARLDVNEAGQAIRRGIVQDITERRQAEAALRESEKMLRTIIDSEPECVKLVSPEGLLIDMNPAGLAMIDADSLDMVKGQPLVTFVTEPHRDAFNRLGAEVFSGKEGRLEFEIVGLKGRRLWMETHAVPLRDEKDSIFAMLAITRDVTERKRAEEQHKRLEEQLMHAHKMEAVGQLAGGVAHDFNNILTSVLGCAELLQMNIDRNSSQRTYVDYILESARRGVSLVRGLLVFSRKDVTYPLPLDLGRAVDDARPFMEKTVTENYELRITHQDDLIIMADRHQIEQVLINLVSNARDAMPSGGTIAIEVAPAEFAEDCEFEGALMKAGRYALLTVTDSGTGIDDRVRERVFEPFFTTKEVGKGTGLGLSIVYGIVKQHGGFIRLLSTPAAGTSVQVYFPLIEEQSELDLGDEQLPRGGDETILLAEDDSVVREITSNLLREFGYTVLVAADGLEAVKMIMDKRDAIKLLILDVIMPKMSGREVYEKVREVWPEAKTLMMSGYSGDHLEGLPSESETLRFLEKPVPPFSLLSAVRSMLDGKEPTGSATLT